MSRMWGTLRWCVGALGVLLVLAPGAAGQGSTPQLSKSFSPGQVQVGDTTDLTFTITNPGATVQTWSFTDQLAAGLEVARPTAVSNTCTAPTAVTATLGDQQIQVNGRVPAGGSCAVVVRVMVNLEGTHVNSAGNITAATNITPPTTPTDVDCAAADAPPVDDIVGVFVNCDFSNDPPANDFTIKQNWEASQGTVNYQTPVVGDVFGTGDPAIVVGTDRTITGGNPITERVARDVNVYDGASGALLHSITTPRYSWSSFAAVALVDVNGDGRGEIIFRAASHSQTQADADAIGVPTAAGVNGRLIAYEYDPAGDDWDVMWVSDQRYDHGPRAAGVEPRSGGALNVADFNGDGTPEAYVGNQIFNAATGARLAAGGENESSGCQSPGECLLAQTVAFDANGDGDLELAAGDVLYDVAITNPNGEAGNTMSVAEEADPTVAGARDGFTAVADMDLDGAPEIVVMAASQSSGGPVLYVWDPQTGDVEGTRTGGTNGGTSGGPPMIGDIDGDERPEVVVVFVNRVRAYDFTPGTGLTNLWTLATVDGSGGTSMSMFDFNNDGKQEIVYRDEQRIRIMDGGPSPGSADRNLAAFQCGSGTSVDMPVIADIDGSGEARIAVTCGATNGSVQGHLRTYETNSFPWANSRPVWNQQAYFVTHINDDLTVPTPQFPNWTVFNDPDQRCSDGANRPLNNFQVQVTDLDSETGCPVICVPPSLEVDKTSDPATGAEVRPGDTIEYTITIENTSSADVPGADLTDDLSRVLDDATITAGPTVSPPAAGTAQITGTELTFNGTIPQGQTVTIAYEATVKPRAQLGDRMLGNSVIGEFSNCDGVTGVLRCKTEHPVVDSRADLELGKSAPTAVDPGDPMTYQLTVTNRGPDPSAGSTVTDTLPAGLTNIQTVTPGCVVSGQTVTCDVGPLAVNGQTVIVITADAPPQSSTCFENDALVVGDDEDPQGNNDEASADTCTTPVIAPDVTCTSDPNVFNTGYDAATGGILANGANDAVWRVAGPFFTPGGTTPPNLAVPPPAGATFGPAVVGNQAPGAWSPSPYGNAQWISQPLTGGSNGDWYYRHQFRLDPAVDPATLSLQMSFLADNSVTEVYVNGIAQSGKTTGLPQNSSIPYTFQGFRIQNAAATTLDHDWKTGLNTIVVQIKSFGPAEGFLAQIRPSAVCPVELGITKTASLQRYEPGDPLTYTIEVTNAGPGVASGLTVTDQLPPQLVGGGFTWTCTATAGSSCEPSGTGAINDAPAGAYPGPSIAVNGKLTYVLTGTVPATASGVLTNTAAVEPPPGTVDRGCAPDCTATEIVSPVEADLRLEKQAPALVDPGDQVAWTLTVHNDGPDDSSGSTVTDTLPAGFTNIQAAGCTVAGQTVTCDVGPIAAGGQESIVITADIPNVPSTCFDNDASVVGEEPDPAGGNDDASARTCTTPAADLRLVKQAPALVDPGDQVTWTLTVHNDGPNNSSGSTVTDTLPAGFTSIQAPANCTVAGQTVTCDVGPIASGGQESIVITANIPNAPSTCFENDATVVGDEGDPVTGNDDASARTCTTPAADLRLSKTAPATVNPADPVSWTLTVHNDGPNDSSGSTVIDTLPAGFTSIQAPANCTVAGQTVTCDVGPIASGGQESIVITADAPNVPSTCFENDATVVGDQGDPVTGNDDASARTCTTPAADLELSKNAPATVDPGGQVTWTLTVANDGPNASSGAIVTDTLPIGITSIQSQTPGCNVQGRTVTCNLGALPANQSTQIVITGNAPNAGTSCFQNDASVDGNEGDPVTGNDDASVQTCTNAGADLEIAKTASPGPHLAGTDVTYTLAVTNNGPAAAHDVEVSDDLPAALTLVSATPDQGTCNNADPLDCDLGTIAAGDTVEVEIVATIGSSQSGNQIQNTACAEGAEPDPDTANDCDDEPINVVPEADLATTKAADPGPYQAGGNVTYRIRVTNNGPNTATNAGVDDDLPAGLTFVAATPAQGTCNNTDPIHCDLGTIASGDTVEIVVVATIGASQFGNQITNTACTDATELDPVATNDCHDEPIGVEPKPPPALDGYDLSLVKSAKPAKVKPGDELTYTFKVSNSGPATAPTATVTDELPKQLAYVSDTADCNTIALPTLTCEVGPITAGQTKNFKVVTRVKAGAKGTIKNSAVVSSGGDTDPANNDSEEESAVAPAAGGGGGDPRLVINKEAKDDTTSPGGVVAYRITVRNKGSVAARNVKVCDRLPDGQSVLRAPGAESASDDKVCWKLERLDAGEKETFRIVTQVDLDAPLEPQVNRASVRAANAPGRETDKERIGVSPAGGACRVLALGFRC